ncbi:hypothetical protein PTKIN_Ptkin03bG0011600 [Pterospermum kingtungense]
MSRVLGSIALSTVEESCNCNTMCMERKTCFKELRKLKMAARETGALQAANNKLENQVEELRWRLRLE